MTQLTRTWHGLPIYAWAAIAAVVLLLGWRYYKGHSSAATNPGTAATNAATGATADNGLGAAPGLLSPDSTYGNLGFYGGSDFGSQSPPSSSDLSLVTPTDAGNTFADFVGVPVKASSTSTVTTPAPLPPHDTYIPGPYSPAPYTQPAGVTASPTQTSHQEFVTRQVAQSASGGVHTAGF